MDLSIYDIIIGPVATEKSYKLQKKLKRLVIQVHPQANKSLIKNAIKMLFNAEVEAVNIINRQGKVRKSGRRVIQGVTKKIAIATLAKGYSLDFFDQSGNQAAPEQKAE